MKDRHAQIRALLANGDKVFSLALGRVGEVISCNPHPSGYDVEICSKSRSYAQVTSHNHTHGATTFNHGDPVHIEKRAGGYYILNDPAGHK